MIESAICEWNVVDWSRKYTVYQSMCIPGILLLALRVQATGVRRTPAAPASIEGIVVQAGTNTPIPGATVELTGIASRIVEGGSTFGDGVISVSVLETASDGSVLSYKATTRRDGRFELKNIRPGPDYQLIALPLPNYLPAQFGQRVPAAPGRSLT